MSSQVHLSRSQTRSVPREVFYLAWRTEILTGIYDQPNSPALKELTAHRPQRFCRRRLELTTLRSLNPV